MSGPQFEVAAREAALEGGRVLREMFAERTRLRVDTKGLHDYVTDADRAAEAAVLDLLQRRFPDHAFLSEERAPRSGSAAYRWVVDPLDGTTNFVHGLRSFAVSVAVEDDVGPLAGAIHDPLHDETFHAHRGGGARLNDAPIHCSRPAGLHAALLATGFPFRDLSRLDAYLRAFERFSRGAAALRRAGSAALDLAYVACGRHDGFWELGLSRWDLAAGVLLVAEAGGRVSDLVGGPGYLESGDVVASSPELHESMLAITREAFG